jgi:hypothetical protein
LGRGEIDVTEKCGIQEKRPDPARSGLRRLMSAKYERMIGGWDVSANAMGA